MLFSACSLENVRFEDCGWLSSLYGIIKLELDEFNSLKYASLLLGSTKNG